MKLYITKDDFIKELRTIDHRVLINTHGIATRPYYFLEIKINGCKFAIPFSSPKSRVRYNPFTQVYINGQDQSLGRLFLLNMIPFHHSYFIKVNVCKIKNEKYRFLLQDQMRGLTKSKKEIENKATTIYNARYNKKHYKYKMLLKNCVDYKKLQLYLNL